jgi:hypothetical protein
MKNLIGWIRLDSVRRAHNATVKSILILKIQGTIEIRGKKHLRGLEWEPAPQRRSSHVGAWGGPEEVKQRGESEPMGEFRQPAAASRPEAAEPAARHVGRGPEEARNEEGLAAKRRLFPAPSGRRVHHDAGGGGGGGGTTARSR